MNDHNLDDLIIGDPEPGNPQSKTLLSVIALLIVILIVGLILWALLLEAPQTEPSDIPAHNQTQPLDPALTPLDPGSNKMPPLTPEPITTPLTPAPKSTPKPTPAPAPAPKPQPTPPDPMPVIQPDSAPAAQPANVPSSPSPTQKTQPTPIRGELIKTAEKPIYYIQVGAFKHAPNPRFMKKLKEAGFTFITKTVRGVRRVRVGPYDTFSEAKAALKIVKKKIGIDGLIVKF